VVSVSTANSPVSKIGFAAAQFAARSWRNWTLFGTVGHEDIVLYIAIIYASATEIENLIAIERTTCIDTIADDIIGISVRPDHARDNRTDLVSRRARADPCEEVPLKRAVR
jgi:hypothetical protein